LIYNQSDCIHQTNKMNNPTFFANKKDQIVFIYRIHDNCLFQLGTLKQNENVILDIPSNSYLSIKRGNLIGEILVPNETILETANHSHNHYHF
jgi:hypothetical protein